MLIQKNWELVSIHQQWKLKLKPSKLADGCRSWIPGTARCLCHLLLTKHCWACECGLCLPCERGLCLCQQQEEEGEAVWWGRNVPCGVPSLWPGLLASHVRIGLGLLQGYKTPSCWTFKVVWLGSWELGWAGGWAVFDGGTMVSQARTHTYSPCPPSGAMGVHYLKSCR